MTQTTIHLNAYQANSIASFANITAPKTDIPILQHAKMTLSEDGVQVIATDRYALAHTNLTEAELNQPLPATPVEIMLSPEVLKFMKTKYSTLMTYDQETNELTITANGQSLTTNPTISPDKFPDINTLLTNAITTEPTPVAIHNLNLTFVNRISKLVSSQDTNKGNSEPKFTITSTGEQKPVIFKRKNLTVLLQPLWTKTN